MEKEFLQLLKDQSAYEEALALIFWDLRTKIPKNGVDQRSEVIGFLSQKIHQISTSDQMKKYIDGLKNTSQNEIVRKSALDCEEEYERKSKIPDEEYKEYIMLQSKSESVWQEAREKGDFSLLQPYLEQLVAYNKKFAEYWGYEKNRYDALLHTYEPGMTTELLDQVFSEVRKELTTLVEKINQSNVTIDPSLMKQHFPKDKQEQFSQEILKRMGYDFNAGRLDETIHPFAISLNQGDVRVTTRYDEEDFRMAIFGTIHEGGHALYEQNISKDLAQTPLSSGTSMGIHESQSLFWENFISRSEEFWENHYDLFKSIAPKSFEHIELKDFYKAINEVKPSYIRIEADELTYCLHIMIRYELEKALINDEIEVKDLPELWNQKMEDYLGIRPTSDKEGVLQDIHWSAGNFGYFPSYALGYMYAAQFYHVMKKDLDVNTIIKDGNFVAIKEWLSTHIHQYGRKKKPLELLKDITGESLEPRYLVAYLKEKYSKIYNI
ncbi:carboxypeptidase M32 [Aquibacillus koreensis]|uniref:Metal-dependent carboxypeptidase n=1 Tax=Aquibacillus koreensis TaxID=279446 RepID=A0A9X3WHX3_9BACI|nr:carboxypeptidase M32 [Aquibacillus koreensis]MCT2537339.1 carboxypeptidase M32 [Aquibacillus koreensis]MDC3418785.1 carboxypeptidase M32 [Aquibacillus koreensis]